MRLNEESLASVKNILFEAKNRIERVLGCEATVNFTLHSTTKELTQDRMTIDKVMFFVSKHTGITPLQIIDRPKPRPVTEARHLAFKLCYEDYTLGSLKSIGLHMGGRDHTTIMNGINVCNDLIKTDANFRTMYNDIKRDCDRHLGIMKAQANRAKTDIKPDPESALKRKYIIPRGVVVTNVINQP